MPVPKFDWYAFGDELRNAAANIYTNIQEAKRLRGLASQQEKEFKLKQSQVDAQIRAQANADAIAMDKARNPAKYNLPVKQQVEYLTPKEVNVKQAFTGVGGKKSGAAASISPYVSMLNDADTKLLSIKNTLADMSKINKDDNYQKTADLINQLENEATETNLETVYNKLYQQIPKSSDMDFKTFVNYLTNAKSALEKRFFAKRQLMMPMPNAPEATNENQPISESETDPLGIR